MSIYQVAAALVAGICFAYGLLYLFIGLRRGSEKKLSLMFAVFALAYAGTVFNGVRFHTTESLETYVALVRADTIFVVAAWVGLIWFISTYTRIGDRRFLLFLTSVFVIVGMANIFRPDLIYGQVIGLKFIETPWGELLAYLDATDSYWSALLLLMQLLTLAFLAIACVLQFRRGERRDAISLGIGVGWFVGALILELLGEAGVIPLFNWGEFGFLGLAVTMSLHMTHHSARLVRQERFSAAVEERRRLASDLHDSVTQTLYSVSIVAAALPRVLERSPEEAKRSVLHLRNMTLGALAEMRILLFELRPEALEAAKLSTLLQQAADVLTGRSHIPVVLNIDGDPSPPVDVKLAYYRITQEALNNIAKHAKAARVIVDLQVKGDGLLLRIEDDGRGYDLQAESESGLGLKIMQERALKVGARLDIESISGQGTAVQLRWSEDGKDDRKERQAPGLIRGEG
jgi:signal transduction histidine kinase